MRTFTFFDKKINNHDHNANDIAPSSTSSSYSNSNSNVWCIKEKCNGLLKSMSSAISSS